MQTKTINNKSLPVSDYEYSLGVMGWDSGLIPLNEKLNPLIEIESFAKDLISQADIRSWPERWPNSNLGLLTGEVSGIIVLESTDSLNNDLSTLYQILGRPEEAGYPRTPYSYSNKNREFLFFKHSNIKIKSKEISIGDVSFIIRGEGDYVPIPYSLSHEDEQFNWHSTLNPLYADLEELPDELLEILTK